MLKTVLLTCQRLRKLKITKNTLQHEWSLIAGLDEGPGLVTRDITFSFYAFLWRRCTTCNFQTVHSPLFFHEIVEIQRVLPLMANIFIFKRAEGAGVGDLQLQGEGARTQDNNFLYLFLNLDTMILNSTPDKSANI